MFVSGGSVPRSNPLPFYIPFFIKRTSFIYLRLTNGTLSHTLFRTLHPFYELFMKSISLVIFLSSFCVVPHFRLSLLNNFYRDILHLCNIVIAYFHRLSPVAICKARLISCDSFYNPLIVKETVQQTGLFGQKQE